MLPVTNFFLWYNVFTLEFVFMQTRQENLLVLVFYQFTIPEITANHFRMYELLGAIFVSCGILTFFTFAHWRHLEYPYISKINFVWKIQGCIINTIDNTFVKVNEVTHRY